jgi:hypothetical protein
MNLDSRLNKLEAAIGDASAWDLTLLTDAELIALERCLSEAVAVDEPLHTYITPELEAALLRVKR